MMEKKRDTKQLKILSNRLRSDVLLMIHRAGTGHPGGSLSCLDLLTCLYFAKMRVDPERPDWPERDRFVMSKGHACPALYAILAHMGFFPREELWRLRQVDAMLQGHPDIEKTPGIDMTAGSLGQGLSAGLGMALGARYQNLDSRVYVLIGDGDIQEGQTWEAAMAAAHHRVDNLTAIFDYNGLQGEGPVSEVMKFEPIYDKFAAFGWAVIEIDGHDYDSILEALDRAELGRGQPTIIIARTMKGKGVSFMEGQVNWLRSCAPSDEQLAQALKELEA